MLLPIGTIKCGLLLSPKMGLGMLLLSFFIKYLSVILVLFHVFHPFAPLFWLLVVWVA